MTSHKLTKKDALEHFGFGTKKMKSFKICPCCGNAQAATTIYAWKAVTGMMLLTAVNPAKAALKKMNCAATAAFAQIAALRSKGGKIVQCENQRRRRSAKLK